MGLKDTFKTILSDTTGFIGESYDDAVHLLKDTLNRFYDIKHLTAEKLAMLANDLIALSPIIEETGFRTKEVNLGVSVPPRVVFHFEKCKDVSREEIQKIMEAHSDKILLKVIVTTLLSADDFQRRLTMGTFKFTEIDIEVGVPPQVNVKLVNSSSG